MRKRIIIIGLILAAFGFIAGFLAGAVLPGNITIPLIYGSNQTFWLFITAVGFIMGIVGLFLKRKNK